MKGVSVGDSTPHLIYESPREISPITDRTTVPSHANASAPKNMVAPPLEDLPFLIVLTSKVSMAHSTSEQ